MTSWLKKLRAVGVAGLVGTCGGAVLGSGIWLLDQLGNTTTGTGLVPRVLGTSALAGVAATLFALGLILYGRLFGARKLSRHASMALGAIAAPLAYVVIALATGETFAGWGIADWLLVLAITSAPGSWIGTLIFDRTVRPAGEADEPAPELMAPNPLETRDIDVTSETRSRTFR